MKVEENFEPLLWAVGVGAVVLLVSLTDYLRFLYFLKKKPTYKISTSYAACLSQDRLWSLDVPNVLMNLFIVIFAFFLLLYRDYRLSILVFLWFSISYLTQSWIGRGVALIAKDLENTSAIQIALDKQSDILKWQVLGNGSSSILKTLGQLVIYFVVMSLH